MPLTCDGRTTGDTSPKAAEAFVCHHNHPEPTCGAMPPLHLHGSTLGNPIYLKRLVTADGVRIFTCCQLASPNFTLLTSGIAIHKHNCRFVTLRHNVRAHFCPALSDIRQNTAVFNVPKLRHLSSSSPPPFLTSQQFP